MQFVKPEIFHLASTGVNELEVAKYLAQLGAIGWQSDNCVSEAEYLIEIAGRRCYKSFGVELNPNLTKVREGNHAYIGNILKTKHGSVIEHAYDTFAIENVSRIFTHELVRHRLSNYSQESMRFVRPTNLSTIFPGVYTEHLSGEKAKQVEDLFKSTFERAEEIQQQLVDIIGMDDPNLNFTIKKLFQSANRRLIPDGMTTGIIVTTNHRTWRFTTQLRTAKGAEEEIRYVFNKIAGQLKRCYPAIYQDMRFGENETIYGEPCTEISYEHEKV